jgi:hypothetical protein
MLSNIVSTAAGVGIGHAIGHGLTGMFGGGSSTPAVAADDAVAAPANQNTRVGACDADAKAFTKCMDDYKGDMTACSWYLDQLKVCSPPELVLMNSLVNRWQVSIRLSYDLNFSFLAFAKRVDR